MDDDLVGKITDAIKEITDTDGDPGFFRVSEPIYDSDGTEFTLTITDTESRLHHMRYRVTIEELP